VNIGIIGAGKVGGSLGRLLAGKGHQIMFGVRDIQKVQPLLAEIGVMASAGTIGDAVAFGEVVILAARPDGLPEIVSLVGDWTGKVVIDAMNRFTPPPAESAGSVAEDVAKLLPGANVVKAFNTTGAENYGQPQFGTQAATMLICGNDADAKSVVTGLAEQLGFEVIDAGALSAASMLEGLARLWVHLAYQVMGNRHIAFKLLRR
jgi:predicted dinucleotide-binding enzyme